MLHGANKTINKYINKALMYCVFINISMKLSLLVIHSLKINSSGENSKLAKFFCIHSLLLFYLTTTI